ncbi:M-phase inducer phosphatase-like [Haliotis asinina]|uniref:M-phase inducer phosphatase-like n=1 Tax=Haliotis asinina TaxID=109174 RepID=UPI003531F411
MTIHGIAALSLSAVTVSPQSLVFKKTSFLGPRKSLFTDKRPRDNDDDEDEYVVARQIKKQKTVDIVNKRAQKEVHCLPTIQGRHKDLKSVSAQTVSQLLAGKYADLISSYQIIDCRYPYEYEGGHIEGAENLHNQALITDLVTGLQHHDKTQRNILIFHCEFSSERGPKLLRHLRNLDRKLNSDRYPSLFYPEVYLLDGGYKAFYEQHQSQCNPRNYVPMLHQNYSKQLRHFRVKSKSWTAGDKQNMRSRRHQIDASPLKMCLW